MRGWSAGLGGKSEEGSVLEESIKDMRDTCSAHGKSGATDHRTQ